MSLEIEAIEKRLSALEEIIPASLSWDWYGTNHYELTDVSRNAPDFWWLTLPDVFIDREICISDTEDGQRVGWIVEYALLSRKIRELKKQEGVR